MDGETAARRRTTGAIRAAFAGALAGALLWAGMTHAAPKNAPDITPKIVVQTGHDGDPGAAVWLPDGHHLLSLGVDQQLIWWDTDKGGVLDKLPLNLPSQDHQYDDPVLLVSRDGRHAIAGVWPSTNDSAAEEPLPPLRIVDLTTHRDVGELALRPVAWIDGRRLIANTPVCGFFKACELSLVDITTGRRQPLGPDFDNVLEVSVSPDGRYLAAAVAAESPNGRGRTAAWIRIWRTADLTRVTQFSPPRDYLQLGFDRAGARFYAVSKVSVAVVDLAAPAPEAQVAKRDSSASVPELGGTAPVVLGMRSTPETPFIERGASKDAGAGPGDEGANEAYVRPPNPADPPIALHTISLLRAKDIRLSPDGQRLATWLDAHCATRLRCEPDALRIFNIAEGRFEPPLTFESRSESFTLSGGYMRWLTDDRLILDDGADARARVIDLTARRQRVLPIRAAHPVGRDGLWIGVKPVSFGKDEQTQNATRSDETDTPVLYDETRNEIVRRFDPMPPGKSKWGGEVDTSGEVLELSPDGRTVALGAQAFGGGGAHWGRVGLWDAQTGKFTRELLNEHLSWVPTVQFSPDSRRLYASGPDERGLAHEVRLRDPVLVWDVATGAQRRSGLAERAQGWSAMAPSPDGKLVAVADPRFDLEIVVASVGSGRRVASLRGSGLTIQTLGFLTDGTAFWATSSDGSLRVWSARDWSELFTLYMLPDDRWMVATPSGAYDTNLPADTNAISWLMPDAPSQRLGPQTFMRDYFQPGLAGRLMECNRAGTCAELLKPKRRLQDLNRTLPVVAIAGVRPADGSDVWVDVDVKEGVELGAPNGKTRSGLHDLRLFRDGKLVGQWPKPAPATPGVADVELAQWATATALKPGRQSFKVRLPESGDGKPGRFTAYAFNDDRVKGETAELAYPPPKVAAPRPRRAYVIAVGVNAYAIPGKSLNFAVNDARAVSGALKAISDYEVVSVPLVADGQANHAAKADLKAVLSRLAGETGDADRLLAAGIDPGQLRRATPDDLVILSFSGHGYADEAGRFFLLPSDAAMADGDRLNPATLISSNELTDWLRDVDAGETAIIIDACHSGASVTAGGFKPGPMGDAGLGQLAFDKGIRILAATQADDVALEDRSLQQGLLTYALVHDGLGAGGEAKAPRDEAGVRLDALLKYAVERMPGLAGKRVEGRLSGRAVQSMLVARTPPARGSGHVQQPVLFDFTGTESGVRLPLAVSAAGARGAP